MKDEGGRGNESQVERENCSGEQVVRERTGGKGEIKERDRSGERRVMVL